ncbi:bestrophin family protein [Thalassoroseus pseudoceratinae]|uniref:bestrophin family protein n=1 Tax=Thalassoroseus pseudoceratinae TaxID=2713176 RepID=UPI0014212FB4|nr:bestrophin family ion channel [Thalassoroseus pseudoceratinae]
MIIRPKTSWIRLLFSLQGSILVKTWKRILFVIIVSSLVTYWYWSTPETEPSLTPLPFQLIAVALGIFLGFRNNEAYDRFWEGRQLWGRMVNVSRTFARQVTMLVDPLREHDETDVETFRQDVILRTIAYVHAFRHRLRDTDPYPELEAYLEPAEISELRRHTNVPIGILQNIGGRLREAYRQRWVSEYHLPVLEASLTEMTSVQGGCERIKATPIPFAYTVLIHRLVAAYCVALPFGIYDNVQLMTPVVTLLISYSFFGLDAIGEEIEEPFGMDANDLSLNAISRTIEIDLRQILAEEEVPPPWTAEDSVLT